MEEDERLSIINLEDGSWGAQTQNPEKAEKLDLC